jgi:hypothetical protein
MDTTEKRPLVEAIRLYNKFNTMYTLNTPAEIRMARRIACHSAQVHIDIIRNPKMSTDELTFWALVYNELEIIKKSI